MSDKFLLRSPSLSSMSSTLTDESPYRTSIIPMGNEGGQMEQNIEFIRQRMSELKDTADTSNLHTLYRSVP